MLEIERDEIECERTSVSDEHECMSRLCRGTFASTRYDESVFIKHVSEAGAR